MEEERAAAPDDAGLQHQAVEVVDEEVAGHLQVEGAQDGHQLGQVSAAEELADEAVRTHLQTGPGTVCVGAHEVLDVLDVVGRRRHVVLQLGDNDDDNDDK